MLTSRWNSIVESVENPRQAPPNSLRRRHRLHGRSSSNGRIVGHRAIPVTECRSIAEASSLGLVVDVAVLAGREADFVDVADVPVVAPADWVQRLRVVDVGKVEVGWLEGPPFANFDLDVFQQVKLRAHHSDNILAAAFHVVPGLAGRRRSAGRILFLLADKRIARAVLGPWSSLAVRRSDNASSSEHQ